MSDFDRRQADHWFGEACRYAQLTGGITGWANAPLDPTFGTTPDAALANIRRLLAEHTAGKAVTGHDHAA